MEIPTVEEAQQLLQERRAAWRQRALVVVEKLIRTQYRQEVTPIALPEPDCDRDVEGLNQELKPLGWVVRRSDRYEYWVLAAIKKPQQPDRSSLPIPSEGSGVTPPARPWWRFWG
jgi:hypothetical protein